MSLPAEVFPPETRAYGMGIFFTIYYLVTVITPIIGGRLADNTENAAIAFTFGGAMLLACIPMLALFNIFANKVKEMQSMGMKA
jgi:MFS family permease